MSTTDPYDGDRVREREVIVTDGRRDSGPGLVIALVGLALVLLLGYLLLNNLGGEDGVVPDEIRVEAEGGAQAPAPDVNVNQPQAETGGGGGGQADTEAEPQPTG